jgi:transcriptional regulator with XRE-family HTH domain
MHIGPQVQALRIQAGFDTIYAAAKATGLSQGLLYDVEQDNQSPSVKTLKKIAEAYSSDVRVKFIRPRKRKAK